ncbi:hypothetical protein quinque_009420 [Culex quinquefasciatus]
MEDNFTNFEAGTVAVKDGGVPPVARVPSTRRRNVVTQHGSYRTVDEENIVVLVRCHTPQPKVEDAEEQVVWFEDFFEPTEEENKTIAIGRDGDPRRRGDCPTRGLQRLSPPRLGVFTDA